MLPGCRSAWKKLWRNTWVKKISAPRSASSSRSNPASRSAATSSTGMPSIRSRTRTSRRVWGPVHLGDLQQPGPVEVAPQGGRGRALAQHVELVEEDLLELRNDRRRVEPAHRRNEALREARDDPQEPHVAPDHLLETRPHHLDDDRSPAREPCLVHLGDGGGGEGRFVERLERLPNGGAEGTLHDLPGRRARERRHVVTQERQLRGNVVGDEIRTGGQGLPELHEDGSERLEGPPDPDPARRPPRIVRPAGPDPEHDEVEAVSHRDARDADQPQQPPHRIRE